MTLSKLARWLYSCHYCRHSFEREGMFNDRCCTTCATARYGEATVTLHATDELRLITEA